MPSYIDIKKYFKIGVVVIFILIIAITLKTMINLSPSQADIHDNISVDIGDDGFLIANLEECLKTNEEEIDDGFALTEDINKIHWYNAKNISFVDSSGITGYMIVWKTSKDNYDMNNETTDYGTLSGKFKNACYFITYNSKTSSIYGIILNKPGYNINNLIYDVLGLNPPTQDENTYNTSSNYNTNIPNYRDSSYNVDNSPETIAKNDPDWYYDHYEYGDYPEIDDYLESQGYEGDYPNDYPDNSEDY